MKLQTALFLAVVAATDAVSAQAPVPGGSTQDGPTAIHTNRGGFRIPYQYDPLEISRLGAREIRLFASNDRGIQWKHVQSVAPSAGRFDFQATGDGEYWFAVRTLDAQGQLHPGGEAVTPGLIVVVDTQRPSLTINLREREPGKVELQWNAADANLAVETLRLEYTQTGQSDWQPAGVSPQAIGQTSWSVPLGGLVAVRGQVQDRAGNQARSQYQIQVRATSTVQPFAQPAAPPPGPVAGLPGPSFGPAPTTPFSSSGAPVPLMPPSMYLSNTPQPVQPPSGFPGVSGSTTPSRPLDGIPPLAQSMQPSPAANSTGVPYHAGTPHSGFVDRAPRFTTVSDRPGERSVSTRRFQIDYRVDDVGPSGIAAVELYITQDNGQKWYRYGTDEDRRAPFEIEVPGDGVYGFAIRVVSGAGLSDPPPQPGQKPELVVVVDSSPPVVQLFPLRQGQGRETNRILITWQAADQQLADLPIALSYSANPSGPWEPISGWQPNSGNYIWTVGPGIPARLYVRLVARDAAGNLAKVDTPQPVLVDLAKPTARIVDVDSGQQPASY